MNRVAGRSSTADSRRPSSSQRSNVAKKAAVAKDRQFVTALARGLQVLGCFSSVHPELSGTEIAAMLKLPQPTVWRLCRTMIKLGYLESDDNDRLRPALRTLRLGYILLSGMSIVELARPHLQQLADETGGAAGLAVREGSNMRFVGRYESDSPLVMSLSVGSRVPIATSSLGWAYLAGLPPQHRDVVIEEVKAEEKVWRKVGTPLKSALKSFPNEGFVFNAGFFVPGYAAVAAPVIGRNGLPVFAINCGATISPSEPEALKEKIGTQLRDLAALLQSIVVFTDDELLKIW